MKVDIVTPVGVKFSGEAASVTAPGVMGDVGILPGHQPMLAALRTGVCTLSVPGQEPTHLVIDGGYLHVVGGEAVSITTELCETWQEVDVTAARTALEAATATLAATKDDISTRSWRSKKHDVDLADTRLRVAATKP